MLAVPRRLERVVTAIVADPVEVAFYLPEVLSERFAYPVGYIIEEEWEARLHRALGAPWPCPEAAEADRLWTTVGEELASQRLECGRYTYGGFSDGDPAFTRAAWCSVRHRRPEVVVETGVARGVTTRFILEALERNQCGHLYSIDLPHLFDARIHEETAAAVPRHVRERWTYIRGSSRRRLPRLLSETGSVDLFVHDSLHTARNMRFEMDHIWAALSPHGIMIVDDVLNQSFREFAAANRCESMVCRSGDGLANASCPSDLCWAFGIAVKGTA
jgi:hypothetical protein